MVGRGGVQAWASDRGLAGRDFGVEGPAWLTWEVAERARLSGRIAGEHWPGGVGHGRAVMWRSRWLAWVGALLGLAGGDWPVGRGR